MVEAQYKRKKQSGYARLGVALIYFVYHNAYTLMSYYCIHRVINGVSGLTEGLTIELYDPSDCEDEDYIFTSDNLDFGQYQVFEEVSVAE